MVFLLVLPSLSYASYSKTYDEKLNLLSATDPKLAIEQAKEQLIQSKLAGDFQRQLVLYYYMAESYSTLFNFAESEKIVIKALALAKKHNNIRFVSEFIGFESFLLVYKGTLREASKKANIALQFAKETNDYRLIASMLSIRSQSHLAVENYTMALKDTQSALTIFKEYDDRENLTYNYNLLALIYDALGEFEKALKYYDVSSSFDDSGSIYNKAAMYYNKGSTYYLKGDNKLAIENFNSAIEFSSKVNDEATLAYVRYSLADIYREENKLVKAEELVELALNWFSVNEDFLMHLNSNLMIAEINITNDKFDQAKKYLDVVDDQLILTSTSRIQLSVLWVKTKFFSAQGQWEKAFQISQKYLDVQEKLYDKDSKSSIDEVKLKYDIQFDQDKMSSLQNQNKLQQDIIVHEKRKQQYFLGLMALAILMSMGIYYAYRNQRSIKRKLYALSIKDDLTQIANRRYILEILSQLHEKSLEDAQNYTLVMIDLDHFKLINDKYGHFKGNEVLIHFANSAKYILPKDCDIGRLGGEEWLLLLPNHDIADTNNILENLRRRYNNPSLLELPSDCMLHFSSGVKICTGDCLDIEHTLKRIDNAMYEAKANGRNQDIYY